jgi:hypothetical protein
MKNCIYVEVPKSVVGCFFESSRLYMRDFEGRALQIIRSSDVKPAASRPAPHLS